MNSPYDPISNQPQFRGAPGNIPFTPNIQCSPNMVSYVAPVMGNLISIIQREGDANLLRQTLFYECRGLDTYQMYNTPFFLDLLGKTVDILEMRLAYQPNVDVGRALVDTCTEMCAYHAAMMLTHNTPHGYLTQEQINNCQQAVNEYRQLEQQAAIYFTPQQQQYPQQQQQSLYRTSAPMGNGSGGYVPPYNPGGQQQPVRQSGLGSGGPVSPLAQVQAIPVVAPAPAARQQTVVVPLATAPSVVVPMAERPVVVQALRESGGLHDYIGYALPAAFSADYQIAVYRRSGTTYRMQVINIEDVTMDYKLHCTEHLLKNRTTHYETADFTAIRQEAAYRASIEAMLAEMSAKSVVGGIDSTHQYEIVRFYDPVLIERGKQPHDMVRDELAVRDVNIDFAAQAVVFTVVSFNSDFYTDEAANALLSINKAVDFIDLKRLVMQAKPLMNPHAFGLLNRELTNHVNELLACSMNDPATINSYVDDIVDLHDYLTTDYPEVMDKLNAVGLTRILDTTANVESGVLYSEFYEGGNTNPRFSEFETWIFIPLPAAAISLSGYNETVEANRSNTPELFDLLENTRALSSPNIRRTRLITLDGETLWVFRSTDSQRYVVSTHKDF